MKITKTQLNEMVRRAVIKENDMLAGFRERDRK